MSISQDETGIDSDTEARSGGAAVGRRLRFIARTPVLRGVAALLTSRFYIVRGDSMRPAFEPGQRFLVNRAAYASSTPSRGDVVVVRDPRDGSRRYLKRVVGLPGEEVRVLDGMLYVDGTHLVEPYLGGLPSSPGLGERAWRLGVEENMVLGDDRLRSTDSREFGPVSAGLIVGKVWFRYWPLRRWGPVR